MEGLINALLAALIIIIIYRWLTGCNSSIREPMTTVDDIIDAIQRTKDNNGSYADFQKRIGDTSFPMYKYAQLVTLYKTNTLNATNVNNIISTL